MKHFASQAGFSLEDQRIANGDQVDHCETGVHPLPLDELAHELRQPLSTIESLAYYLEITADDDQICRHLQHIRMLVGRASRILDHAAAA